MVVNRSVLYIICKSIWCVEYSRVLIKTYIWINRNEGKSFSFNRYQYLLHIIGDKLNLESEAIFTVFYYFFFSIDQRNKIRTGLACNSVLCDELYNPQLTDQFFRQTSVRSIEYNKKKSPIDFLCGSAPYAYRTVSSWRNFLSNKYEYTIKRNANQHTMEIYQKIMKCSQRQVIVWSSCRSPFHAHIVWILLILKVLESIGNNW